ncbi:unnamed protein product, partial [Allacma fusca]
STTVATDMVTVMDMAGTVTAVMDMVMDTVMAHMGARATEATAMATGAMGVSFC